MCFIVGHGSGDMNLSFNKRVAGSNPCSVHLCYCALEQDTQIARPAVLWQPHFCQCATGQLRFHLGLQQSAYECACEWMKLWMKFKVLCGPLNEKRYTGAGHSRKKKMHVDVIIPPVGLTSPPANRISIKHSSIHTASTVVIS